MIVVVEAVAGIVEQEVPEQVVAVVGIEVVVEEP